MATGALYANKCFSTQAEALDAYYAAALPAYTAGATSYMSEYIKVGAAWKVARYSISSTGAVTTLTQSNAPVITFPACATADEGFIDGIAIGWLLAAVLVSVWGFKKMREQLR